MRSFLRGSLYGVSATSSWISPPQQQPQQQSVPAATTSPTSSSNNGANNNNNTVSSSSSATHHHQYINSTTTAPQEKVVSSNNNNSPTTTSTTTTSPTTTSATATVTAAPLHFASRANYGGFPIYGSNVSESETATLRAERSIRGKVAKWFDQRGFGFIEDVNTEQQYFVHARDLITVEGGQKSLFPGQTVEFEPEQTENGGHAMRVSAVGGAPLQAGTLAAPAPASATKVQGGSTATTTTTGFPTSERHVLPAYADSVAPAASFDGGGAVPSSSNTNSNNNINNPAVCKTEKGDVELPQPRVFGTIAHWTSDKGYGFVAVAGQDEHFFTHVKDFTCAREDQSPCMPTAGLAVEFTPSYASHRKRATHVTLPDSQPFQPNIVAGGGTTSSSSSQQQQQQQPLSALAMAFSLPTDKTNNNSSTHHHPDPLWRAGYTNGFVDGQHHFKKEVNNIPILSTPLPRSTTATTTSAATSTTAASSSAASPKHQQLTKPGTTTTTTTTTTRSSASSTRSPSSSSRSPMMNNSRNNNNNSSSNYNNNNRGSSYNNNRSSSSGSNNNRGNNTRSSSSSHHNKNNHKTDNNNDSSNIDHWTGKEIKPNPAVAVVVEPIAAPKWAQSASGWGSSTTTTTTSASPSASASASAPSATTTSTNTATTPTEEKKTSSGFPSFPQRGGFGSSAFGRGRGHGRGF